MRVIGITGGTGAGKTTALEVLREMGGAVIDCDEVYHRLLASSQDMVRAIGARFPGTVENGVLNRKKLGGIVFSSPEELSDLTAITDRYVTEKVGEMLRDAEGCGLPFAAVDAIGLFESGVSEICDIKIAVTAPSGMRLKRIMAREGISREYAEKRISAQRSDEYFSERCDFVLVNDFESLDGFKAYCREFFKKLIPGSK